MAKKPSSGSKRSKRPVNQSAVKGGGIMSLNKSNTSPFMKAVLILLIVSMVMLFLYGGITGIIELFKPRPQPAKVDPLTALKAQWDPQIQIFNAALASDPTSYTLLVNLGNRHSDYARELGKLGSAQTTTTATLVAQQWAAAQSAYREAVKANKDAEPSVLVDYSVAAYYSFDTTGAIRIATSAVKRDPTFAPAYFNLGIYYESSNDAASAIASYQKYLELDPTGTVGGDPDFARQQLTQLGASVTTGSSAATGSAPANQ